MSDITRTDTKHDIRHILVRSESTSQSVSDSKVYPSDQGEDFSR